MRIEKIKHVERQKGALPLAIVGIIALVVILILALVVKCSLNGGGGGGGGTGGVTVAQQQAIDELKVVIDELIAEGSVSDAELQRTAAGVIAGLSGAGMTNNQIQQICREAIRVIDAKLSNPTISVAMGNRLRHLRRAIQQACN